MIVTCRYCNNPPMMVVWRRGGYHIGKVRRPIPDIEIALCMKHVEMLADPEHEADARPWSATDDLKRLCKCGCLKQAAEQPKCAVCVSNDEYREANPHGGLY